MAGRQVAGCWSIARVRCKSNEPPWWISNHDQFEIAHSFPMNVLFVHNNFPAQFRHVARALAAKPGVRVAAIGSPTSRADSGVELIKYRLTDADVSTTHPFARRFDLECRRSEQVLYALSSLATSDLVPDVIVAHCGWGETLPLRAIFPKS